MAVLGKSEMDELLRPYLVSAKLPGQTAWDELLEQLSTYLELLLRWNERMNLTAIRDARGIVERHFGESLFAATFLRGSGTMLDVGSGAGFPGLPVQLWHPGLKVTLAESQGKKAAFLREVVRALSLETEVWAGRAELLTPRRFDQVVMRAVDRPGAALQVALERSRSGVWLLGTAGVEGMLEGGVKVAQRFRVPGRENSFLFEVSR